MRLDDAEIMNILKSIENENGRVGIIGYASALEQIAKVIEKNKLEPLKRNVTSIISISETLNLDTRLILEKY